MSRATLALLETLRSLLEREKSQEAFCPLPFHYMEIAYILFQAYGMAQGMGSCARR